MEISSHIVNKTGPTQIYCTNIKLIKDQIDHKIWKFVLTRFHIVKQLDQHKLCSSKDCFHFQNYKYRCCLLQCVISKRSCFAEMRAVLRQKLKNYDPVALQNCPIITIIKVKSSHILYRILYSIQDSLCKLFWYYLFTDNYQGEMIIHHKLIYSADSPSQLFLYYLFTDNYQKHLLPPAFPHHTTIMKQMTMMRRQMI